MIEHVQRNEPIRASKINEIIDSTEIGSDTLDVIQSDSGTQINLPSNFSLEGDAYDKIFSVAQTTIKGYAYTAINMGTTIQECLNAVKIHNGTNVMSPVSALVVYRNSAFSPDQNHLTGYVLSANQFGQDMDIGSSGWLSTKIEWPHSQFQNDLNLGLWKADDERYMVFTNVDSLSDLKDEISVQLANAGGDAGKLSTLTRDCNFTLLKCTLLSADDGGTPRYEPARQIVHNDGEIHVWNADEGSAPVMWKADLVCYGASDDERSYCWKIWLGPDSTYNQSLQRVIVQAQDGDRFALSAVEVNDIGQVNGTNVTESPYGGYDLLFEPFTANVGSQVTEHSVYMNVEYDKTDMYVDGYVSDSPDTTTDLSSDGILGRSVFIAKNAPFLVPDEQEKVSDSLIRRGTWGYLDFGGPKLDSYVPATDATTSKSLDWTVPQTDNRRPCEPHLMEVKGFASEGAVDYLSTDNVLVRRVDSAGNRELKYVSLSSLSGGGGCSCEMRQVLTAGTLIAQFTNDG